MAQYLREAVESIVTQDYSNLEIILVDDGSTDETSDVLACYCDDPRIKIIRQNNAGQTSAKNRGLQEAKGDYIAFCDADNAWLPGKLSHQMSQFDKQGRIGVVYGDIVFMDEDGNLLPTPKVKRYSGRITSRLLLDNFVTFNTTILSSQVIKEIGGFDASLTMSIDYDLWLRISTRFEFLYLNEPLVRYRIWGGQMSHRMEERLANVGLVIDHFFLLHSQMISKVDKLKTYARLHVSRAQYQKLAGKRALAWQELASALGYRPNDWYAWKSVCKMLLRV